MEITKADIDLYIRFQKYPEVFIEKNWGLTPQPVKPEFKELVDNLILEDRYTEIKEEYFGEFIKGKHITWQQWLIVKAVGRAVRHESKHRISIVSGHGVGKSSIMSMLLLWYLFCYKDSQIPCTAPTSEQMFDVLWKEAKVWLDRMPKQISDYYEWTSGYIRIKERPEMWFARAKTASKDRPEALAGVHGEYVFFLIDEASGVPDEIFKSAEGALTNDNAFVLMISNGTRSEGYFFDTHNSDKDSWINIEFNSEDSPIVSEKFVGRIIDKYGKDSDEYRIRVEGKFPKSEQMDGGGWIPLLTESQILCTSQDINFTGSVLLGIDPSGEGDDESLFIGRDRFVAKCVGKESISDEKSVALKGIGIMKELSICPDDTWIDNFGVGANVSKEIALAKLWDVNAVNWSEEADEDDIYINKRAECYFRAREWCIRGGLVCSEQLKRELTKIKYKNNLGGRKQIMEKKDLKKLLGKSPDYADAFALTFYRGEGESSRTETNINKTNNNPYDVV